MEIRNYLWDQAGSRSLVFDLSIAHDRFGSSSHVQQNGCLSHPQDLDAPLRLPISNNMLIIRTFLFSAIVSTSTRMRGEFLRLLFLQAHRETNVIANQQLGSTLVQARGILQRPEEQSRTGGCQGSSVAGQPQCPRVVSTGPFKLFFFFLLRKHFVT